jgi:cytochrome c oxidase cbb3-type subunit 2
MASGHERIEKNVGLLIVLTLVAVSFGGIAEIVPLFWDKAATEKLDTVEPYTALQMEGRDIYIREGCHVCHTQMVRTLRSETARYGPYSMAGEDVAEHPFLWGSKRTGPDLARVGGKYSDAWQRQHLRDPRSVVPESNMPAYPWLAENQVDWSLTEKKLRTFGGPLGHDELYSDAFIEKQMKKVENEWSDATEMDALVAYLQSLGKDRTRRE